MAAPWNWLLASSSRHLGAYKTRRKEKRHRPSTTTMTTPTSVFTTATAKTFWETGTQMAMTEETMKGLKDEGITMPEDLFE